MCEIGRRERFRWPGRQQQKKGPGLEGQIPFSLLFSRPDS